MNFSLYHEGASSGGASDPIGTDSTPLARLNPRSLAQLKEEHAPREVKIGSLTYEQAAKLVAMVVSDEGEPIFTSADLEMLLEHAKGATCPSDAVLSRYLRGDDSIVVDLARIYRTTGSSVEVLHEVKLERLDGRGLAPMLILQRCGESPRCDVILSWEDSLQFSSKEQIALRWGMIEEAVGMSLASNVQTIDWLPDGFQPQRYSSGSQLLIDTCPRVTKFEDFMLDPMPSLRPDLLPYCVSRARGPSEDRKRNIEARWLGCTTRLRALQMLGTPGIGSTYDKFPRHVVTRQWLEAQGDEPVVDADDAPVQCLEVCGLMLVVHSGCTGRSTLEALSALEQYEAQYLTANLSAPLEGITSVGVQVSESQQLSPLVESVASGSFPWLEEAIVQFVIHESSDGESIFPTAMREFAIHRQGVEVRFCEQLHITPPDVEFDGSGDEWRVNLEPVGDCPTLRLVDVSDDGTTRDDADVARPSDVEGPEPTLRLISPAAVFHQRIVEFFPSNGSPYEVVPHLSVFRCASSGALQGNQSPNKLDLVATLEHYGGISTLGEHGLIPTSLVMRLMHRLEIDLAQSPMEVIPPSPGTLERTAIVSKEVTINFL